MAENIRLVKMERVDDVGIGNRAGVERLEARDHAAACTRHDERHLWCCSARRTNQRGLQPGPIRRCTRLRWLVQWLERDPRRVEPCEPGGQVVDQAEVFGEHRLVK